MQHPEEHDLTALAYGLVEGPERETLLGHLAECDHCRALYDAYRDEQVAVREAIVRDARSGAAEARALENTLRMLGAIDAPETEEETSKRGRLLRLPVWVFAAELAAMLVIGVGLFFILKPGPDNANPANSETARADSKTKDADVIPVAMVDRAPADVGQGEVYVRDTQGEWKQADAVPVDQWVRAGDAKPLTFTLRDGPTAKLKAGAVFRIALDSGDGKPVVYLLHGDGTIDSRKAGGNFTVRAGDTSFLAMPGARVDFECKLPQSEQAAPRQWSRPTYVGARVLDGDVVLTAKGRGLDAVPLRDGETLEWTPANFRVIEPGGKAPGVFLVQADATTRAAQNEKLRSFVMPRIVRLIARIDKQKTERDTSVKELRVNLEEMAKQFGKQRAPQPGKPHIYDEARLIKDSISLVVTSDGKQVTARYNGVSTSADGVAQLRENLPQPYRDMLDCVKFKTDKDGSIHIERADADGKKVEVIITQSYHK